MSTTLITEQIANGRNYLSYHCDNRLLHEALCGYLNQHYFGEKGCLPYCRTAIKEQLHVTQFNTSNQMTALQKMQQFIAQFSDQFFTKQQNASWKAADVTAFLNSVCEPTITECRVPPNGPIEVILPQPGVDRLTTIFQQVIGKTLLTTQEEDKRLEKLKQEEKQHGAFRTLLTQQRKTLDDLDRIPKPIELLQTDIKALSEQIGRISEQDSPRNAPRKQFLQALIQVTAGKIDWTTFEKIRRDNPFSGQIGDLASFKDEDPSFDTLRTFIGKLKSLYQNQNNASEHNAAIHRLTQQARTNREQRQKEFPTLTTPKDLVEREQALDNIPLWPEPQQSRALSPEEPPYPVTPYPKTSNGNYTPDSSLSSTSTPPSTTRIKRSVTARNKSNCCTQFFLKIWQILKRIFSCCCTRTPSATPPVKRKLNFN
jgi:hypothetical protein